MNLFNSTVGFTDGNIYYMVIKGVKKVISTLLKIGNHYKPKDEQTKENIDYNIENRRKILIKTDKKELNYYRYLYEQLSKNFRQK